MTLFATSAGAADLDSGSGETPSESVPKPPPAPINQPGADVPIEETLKGSCAMVGEVARAFSQWRYSWDEARACRPFGQPDGTCELAINDCVPQHVQKIESAFPSKKGPNCFNSVLVEQKILTSLRHSDEGEMKQHLYSSACRELSEAERPEVGDVGAIGTYPQNGNHLIHVFTYLTADWAFSKNNLETSTAYQLQPLREVYRQYEVGPYKRCMGAYPEFAGSCPSRVNFFRCDKTAKFLFQRPLALATLRHVQALERQLERVLFTNKSYTPEMVAHVLLMAEELKKKKRNPEVRLSETALKERGNLLTRLIAIQKQISISRGYKTRDTNLVRLDEAFYDLLLAAAEAL